MSLAAYAGNEAERPLALSGMRARASDCNSIFDDAAGSVACSTRRLILLNDELPKKFVDKSRSTAIVVVARRVL